MSTGDAEDSSPRALAHEWRVWAAENLLRGVSRELVREGLRVAGVPEDVAARCVHEVEREPSFLASRAIARRVRQLEQILRLRTTLASEAPRPGAIDRRPGLDGPTFYQRYFATNTPVILPDFAAGWPALTRWSPAYFAERVGDARLEVETGRERDPDCDINFERHRVSMTMAEFAARVQAAGTSNDLYAIANNRNMDRPGLQALFDDVTLSGEFLDDARRRGCVALWFGPAGTRTALHHDTSNILFVQIRGRKRFYLGAPTELALLQTARGVYNKSDCARVLASAPEYVDIHELVLEPGETLFIPVGWWHQVHALELSISLAFNNLRRRNIYDWYKPGAVSL